MKKSISDKLFTFGFVIGLTVFIVLIFLFPPSLPILLCTAMPLIGYLKFILKIREGRESAQQVIIQFFVIGGVMIIGLFIPLALGGKGITLVIGVVWAIAAFFLGGMAMLINDITND